MPSKRRSEPPPRRRDRDPGRIDLHVHTDRSDGRYPPDQVLDMAFAGGLDVVAIADHDLPNVVTPGVHERDGRSLRVLAAAELSGSHDGREFHLLVYFPGEMPEDFRAFLRTRAQSRAARYDAALDRLGLSGPLADDDARSGARSLTRHHVFTALRASGAPPGEGYTRLSGSEIVPLIDLPYVDAIATARAAGGFTSWAHPTLADAQKYCAVFVAAGLQGLEGVRPRMDRRTRNGLKSLADKHGLLLTGGSDWHGWHDMPLGTFAVTGERAERFVARLDRPAA